MPPQVNETSGSHAAHHNKETMSFVIKREHKAVTTVIAHDGEEFVVHKPMPDTMEEFDGVTIGSFVNFYNRGMDQQIDAFGPDALIGKIIGFKEPGEIEIRSLGGQFYPCIYPHHLTAATQLEVASAMFKAGDKVVVLDGSLVENVTLGSVAGRIWDFQSSDLVGKVFTVERVCADGDLYLGTGRRYISPEYVRKATPHEIAGGSEFKVGESVVLLDGRNITAKRGSLTARRWTDRMTPLIGMVSKIHNVDSDGDAWLVTNVGETSPDFLRKATSDEIASSTRFTPGEQVVVLNAELVKNAGVVARGSRMGREWTADKRRIVGKHFVISSVCRDDDVVLFGAGVPFISPDYLRKLTPAELTQTFTTFSPGDYVVCDSAHPGSDGGVGWVLSMTKALGKIGRVKSCTADRVSVHHQEHGEWLYKAEWLRRVAPNDAEMITLLNTTLAAFKGQSDDEKTSALAAFTSALGKRKSDG